MITNNEYDKQTFTNNVFHYEYDNKLSLTQQ